MKDNLERIKVILLAVIACCAIILVIQGIGKKKVYVRGGYLDVSGSVSINNTVSANVSNTVDVNIEEVIGHQVGCHKAYVKDGRQYWAVDVFNTGF